MLQDKYLDVNDTADQSEVNKTKNKDGTTKNKNNELRESVKEEKTQETNCTTAGKSREEQKEKVQVKTEIA